ncbi:MAG TPA: hypothetical protein VGQ07_05700 [Nitrospirales bacterium]|jgi:hypothetical protein|nr:hypothetical protein [Nitrospirales bacterium]
MLSKIPGKVSRLFQTLFKKKATPHEIGLNFVEMILKSREAKRETRGALASLSEQTRERVQFETMLLQGFVIEYVTSELFRDRPEKQGILTAYRGVLDDLAEKDPVWKAFDAELRQRTLLYAEAVIAPTLDVLLNRIGDAFAGACGDVGNTKLSTLGILEFEMQYVATCKLCCDYIGAFA